MTKEEQELQFERMRKNLDFDWWLQKAQGRSYVPVGNPEDGEVVLEEIDYNEEEVYP